MNKLIAFFWQAPASVTFSIATLILIWFFLLTLYPYFVFGFTIFCLFIFSVLRLVSYIVDEGWKK